jgi:hypothetical protein
MAGNSTSDNVGPQHLINIKRLAYTVRTPEQAFEMPLDYTKAPDAVAASATISRSDVVNAVERYLASKGIAVAASAAPAASSCGCSTPTPVKQSVVSNVAADVVDQFLAKRGGAKGSGGYS